MNVLPGRSARIFTVVLGIVGAVVGGFISIHMLGFGDVTGFHCGEW
jgi:uncharacterized membrane protein YeaQ/YmgE (transglycosylase-associated protein family)